MISPDKTTDEFINKLFAKRDYATAGQAYKDGYARAKAFAGVKPAELPTLESPDIEIKQAFINGYKRALYD